MRQIVREIPVAGRIVFLDCADFTNGVPSMVTTVDDLMDEFGEPDKAATEVKFEAFMPHWDLIHQTSEVLVTGRLSRKRQHV